MENYTQFKRHEMYLDGLDYISRELRDLHGNLCDMDEKKSIGCHLSQPEYAEYFPNNKIDDDCIAISRVLRLLNVMSAKNYNKQKEHRRQFKQRNPLCKLLIRAGYWIKTGYLQLTAPNPFLQNLRNMKIIRAHNYYLTQ